MDLQPGQEPINVLGVVVGVGLGLLILVLSGYAFVRWYQRSWCWHRHRPSFVFNLYRTRGLGSVAVELVPPFSISGSLSTAESSYVPFHNQGL